MFVASPFVLSSAKAGFENVDQMWLQRQNSVWFPHKSFFHGYFAACRTCSSFGNDYDVDSGNGRIWSDYHVCREFTRHNSDVALAIYTLMTQGPLRGHRSFGDMIAMSFIILNRGETNRKQDLENKMRYD
jgi:hypothetical protein